jgi:hypothetical protein
MRFKSLALAGAAVLSLGLAGPRTRRPKSSGGTPWAAPWANG